MVGFTIILLILQLFLIEFSTMKKLLIILFLLPIAVLSCKKEERPGYWLLDERYFIAESDDNIPESPWTPCWWLSDNPEDWVCGSPFMIVFVHNQEGEDLLSPDSPGSFNGVTVIGDGHQYPPYYNIEYPTYQNKDYRLMIMTVSYGVDYYLDWPDGSRDTVGVFREFSKDGKMFRLCFILNGEKQYSPEFYLVK